MRKKIILLLVIVLLLVVGAVVYSYYPLIRTGGDLLRLEDCDFTLHYSFQSAETEQNEVLSYFKEGRICGSRRSEVIHAQIYLAQEQIAVSECYLDAEEIKFNLTPTYDYFLEKMNLGSWSFLNLNDDYYISGEQLKEIVGWQEETPELPEVELSWSAIFDFHAQELPANSSFAAELQEMQGYVYQPEEGEPILIGVERKKSETPKVYLSWKQQGSEMELLLTYESTEDGAVIEMPSEAVNEDVVDIARWIYQRIQDWMAISGS